jgi:hypothetical protein
MIEVFKTNVIESEDAQRVLQEIRSSLKGLDGNFDLQDCDHILRVTSRSETIHPDMVIDLLARIGHYAEVLADEYQDMEEALQMP